MTKVTILAMALLANVAFAQTTDVTDYKAYVDRLIKIMKENPGMNPYEARNRALGISEGDDKFVPEKDLFKSTKTLSIPMNASSLTITLGRGGDSVHVTEEERSDISVDVLVYSSKDAAAADQYSGGILAAQTGNEWTVGSNVHLYYCSTATLNGKMTMSGTCYYKIDVKIPKNSQVLVRDNEGKRLTQLDQPLSYQEMFSEIKNANFTERKAKAIALIQKSKGTLTGAQVKAISAECTFTDRLELLGAIESKIGTLSAQEAGEVLSDVPFTSRLKALRVLNQHISRENPKALVAMVDDQFSFTEKNDALALLMSR